MSCRCDDNDCDSCTRRIRNAGLKDINHSRLFRITVNENNGTIQLFNCQTGTTVPITGATGATGSAPIIFAARLTTDIVASPGTPADIIWDDVLTNNLGTYNGTTGVLTITQAGVYDLSYQLGFTPSFTGTFRQAFVTLNGTTSWASGSHSLGQVAEVTETVPCLHSARLAAGDTLLFQGLANGLVNTTISGNGIVSSVRLTKIA